MGKAATGLMQTNRRVCSEVIYQYDIMEPEKKKMVFDMFFIPKTSNCFILKCGAK